LGLPKALITLPLFAMKTLSRQITASALAVAGSVAAFGLGGVAQAAGIAGTIDNLLGVSSPSPTTGAVPPPGQTFTFAKPGSIDNPAGDFGLSEQGLALNLPKPANLFTFSTIALYKRAFFEADWCPIPAGNPEGVKAPLAAMLRAAMDRGLVGASLYDGLWVDVGTPERLAQLN
jgi:hypothetical protein